MNNLIHINNDNDRCVIVFSAFQSNRNTSKFTFYNLFESMFEDSDFIFIKDPSNNWYNRKIIGVGDDINHISNTISLLSSKYKHVTCFGSSMGGYAALLYGCKLNVDVVIAVSPQIFLKQNWPRYNPKIHSGIYEDITSLILNKKTKTSIEIIVGENAIFDVYQSIFFLNEDKIKLTIVPGAFHNVALLYHQRKTWSFFIESIVNTTICSLLAGYRKKYFVDCELYNKINNKSFIDNLKNIFNNSYGGCENREVVLDELYKILKEYPNWYGAMSMLGLLLYKYDNKSTSARLLFEKVRKNNCHIDDIYRPLAKIYAEELCYFSAIDCITEGVRRNRENSTGYNELADFFSKVGADDLSKKCLDLLQGLKK